ncbi:hypothetical protein C8A01DRAFT_31090 [Parachaetomium inaequale]|uniref:Fungal specific transcription factor n=1 Tax=Parachaetomium inaequale TaxID=2588326 RepID=A0AAN6SWR0_9PEZI|nr:hypothetical protein C8A01DRAFT_31090 [Parachaetomium inaequale]
MAGLAASRHAPFSCRPTRNVNSYTPTNLTVTPAPTGGGGADTHVLHSRSSHSYSPTKDRDDEHNHPPTKAQTQTQAQDAHPLRPPPSSAPHELARYTKIIRRLQWKLPFLAQGYHAAAVARVGADPAAVSEAELMFKLDFFEYYMLIERALVHLLGVFGVDVPRGGGHGHFSQQRDAHTPGHHTFDEGTGGNNNNKKGLGASVWRDGGRHHRYHANVLAALDRAENPLHGTLGSGEVRAQLGRAKDLRNRWKTAADDEPDGLDHSRERSPAKGAVPGGRPRKMAAPLDSYRLEHMLEVIFLGFDEAFKIAEAYVRSGLEWAAGDADMLGEDGRVMDWTAIGDEEEQWEFMVDAMDWEAV